MKKNLLAIILIFLIFIILILVRWQPAKSKLENHIEDGDIKVGVSVKKHTYEISDNIEIDGYLTNLGDSSVTLFHSNKINELRIYNDKGEVIYSQGTDDVLFETVLNTNETIEIHYLYSLEKLRILEPGNYDVVIVYEFFINNDPETIKVYEPTISIEINDMD